MNTAEAITDAPESQGAVKRKNCDLRDRERKERRVRLASLPLQVQIEATNRCNLECASCARNYYNPRTNRAGDFDPAAFPNLRPLLRAAERVLIGGYGEPLLGRHIDAILRLAADEGCFTEIITNSSFLDERRVATLGELRVGRVLFSLDAATDEHLRETRGVALADLLARVDLLRAAAPDSLAAFNVTLTRRNAHQLAAIVDLAAAHDVADVYVMHEKLYTRAHAGNSALALPEGELIAAFHRARERAVATGVSLRLPPTSGVHECEQPLELMMIRHDGAAFGCCSAMFAGGTHRIELGYLDRQDGATLWNAPAAQNARARLYGLPHKDGPCDTCAFRVFTPEAMERFLD
ncbi:MAG: radical SAM protein [Deltaproteobacteria bacterium]|nr:radical SAM protein [Deltaproteobacteria bacterium]